MEDSKSSSGKAARDFILLSALLGGLNFAIARHDPGWMQLNPTPWLLLPLLIGIRYGLWPGTITGLLAAAALAVMRARLEEMEPWDFAVANRYPLTALIVAGFVAGECSRVFRRSRDEREEDTARLRSESERLRAELGVSRQARHELQQAVAMHNAPLACLDDELRKLVPLPAAMVHDALLQLLRRLAGVISAGFYERKNGSLVRLAVINPSGDLAETIRMADSRVAEQAIETKSISAIGDPDADPREQPFMAAIPWADNGKEGLLLIADMPVEQFDWRHLSRIELMLHWTFAIRRMAAEFNDAAAGRREASTEEFMLLLAAALETEQTHQLPSSVLRLDDGEAVAGIGNQLAPLLPASAVTSRVPGGGLAVLLPFTADQEAEAISHRIQEKAPSLRISRYVVAGAARLEDLWTRILSE